MKANIAPFYVGQKVVALQDHRQGVFKKGDTFTILGIYKRECCGTWAANIGLFNTGFKVQQCVCGKNRPIDGCFNAYRFAPIQTQSFPLMTFSKIVEVEKEEILIPN